MALQTQAKDLSARVLTSIHEALFVMSKGRFGGKAFGMPVLRLTTIGRKSGQPRTTMLTSPVQDNGNVVLVASYGGDDRHPKWFLNLRDNPDVQVMMGGQDRAMRARVAEPDEKSALWPRLTAAYKGYAQYQTKTDRDIPVVILEPR